MWIRFQRSPAEHVLGLLSSSKLMFDREEEHKMLSLSLVFEEAKGSADTVVTLYD